MSQAFLRRGWLEFWLLELDGTIAAAQFAFRYGDTVYQLQEGLDPAHYPDRAGHILRAHVLQQMITDGVGRYDYLSGPEAYKRNWAAQPGAYTDLHFTAKAFGRAHLFMQARDGAGAAKTWLRVHAPALYAVLRNADYLIVRAGRGRRQRKSQYEGAGAMSASPLASADYCGA